MPPYDIYGLDEYRTVKCVFKNYSDEQFICYTVGETRMLLGKESKVSAICVFDGFCDVEFENGNMVRLYNVDEIYYERN
jgi:hypothetical protein